MIIVYFSGTGNSKYLAEQFAKRMNINAYSIEQNLDFETIFSHEDTIAFCYPIYGSCVPRIMREFVSKYKFYLNEKSWTAYAWINGETGTLFFSYRRKLYWLRTVCKKMSHYIDEDGKEKNVYSWRLDKNDPMPKGKKREPSLREKEKQIEADLFDRIVTNGGNYTVLELVEKYVSLKTGVRHNTVAGYKTVINMLKKESFGNLRIDKVRLSGAKAWLIKLQQIDGRGYSSIHSIRGVLRPAFQLAVDDDLLRKNPFEFELASVIVNDSVTREAITRKQQRDLLKFIQEDKHFSRYYDAIYILFHTGLRISEFCGLTVSEIEFGEMRIKVDHQLQRTVQMQYVIEEPKTDKGIRYVPMTEAVAACFRRIIANRKTPKVEPMVEGYAGFLFLDKNDMPMVALHWEKYMEHIIQKYNRIYRIQMPKVTPHVCRHTFCSNMAKSGMNPKNLQYIMGHADISVTLNTYTHVNFDDAKEEVYRIANS